MVMAMEVNMTITTRTAPMTYLGMSFLRFAYAVAGAAPVGAGFGTTFFP